jgi:hypothetical protein
MKRFATFIGIGSLLATIEEFLTVVVLKRDVASYIFTLVILFPAFLTLVYFSSKLLDRLLPTARGRELLHFFAFGAAGLMIEWFLIGLSPWSNPAANPLLMTLFQLGMFSFWAIVASLPRLLLNTDERSRRFRRRMLAFYFAWFALVYVVALSVPASARFGPTIVLIITGYFVMDIGLFVYFWRSFARTKATLTLPQHGDCVTSSSNT